MTRIAIYARKSTESEDRQVLSIDSQIQALRDFAKHQGLGIPIVLTESKSAKSPGRKVFNELMTLINNGEIEQVICWKLDRLARNPVDGGAIIWAVEERKLRHIHTPQREFCNSGNDKFWMQLEFGMAKKYVDDLSDNVKRGLRAKVAQGWLPCLPPLGYLNDRATRKIVKDPDRFHLVRRMWDMLLTGNHSSHSILQTATEEWGLRTRQLNRIGGGSIAYSAINKMFRNPFYYGKFLYAGELHDGSHPPMVSYDEFERAQQLLGSRTNPRPQKRYFAYTGLITCGECGASVTAEHKVNRHGHRYVYYHCTKRKRNVRCSQRVLNVKTLESQMVSFLESLTISKEFRDWALNALKDLEDSDAARLAAANRSRQARSAAILRETDELLNMKLRGMLSDEEYTSKRNALSRERSRLQEIIDTDSDPTTRVATDVFNVAYRAAARFRKGSPEEKRTILRQVGSNLVLKDKSLSIQAYEPFNVLCRASIAPSGESRRFEPCIWGRTKAKHACDSSFVTHWWSVVREVRTRCNEWQNTPELDMRERIKFESTGDIKQL